MTIDSHDLLWIVGEAALVLAIATVVYGRWPERRFWFFSFFVLAAIEMFSRALRLHP